MSFCVVYVNLELILNNDRTFPVQIFYKDITKVEPVNETPKQQNDKRKSREGSPQKQNNKFFMKEFTLSIDF